MNLYIGLTLICSFFHAVGAILCKYGLQRSNPLSKNSIKEMVLLLIANKFWVLGIAVSLSTNFFVLELQSILDLSIIHSIMNSSYIFTLLLGYIVLKEVLTKRQWLGTATVIMGALIIISVDNPTTGHATNVSALLIQGAISFLLIIFLIVLSLNNKNMNYEILYAASAGIAFGNSQVFVKATTNYITDETGYFTVFSLQSMTQLINVWPTLLIILFAITGFICMQISFTHGKVSICVALMAVISRAISTSSGYYIFGEQFPHVKVIGILTILLGVLIITLSTIKGKECQLATT